MSPLVSSSRSASKPRRRRSGLRSIVELVVTIAIAFILALLVQAFVIKPYRIPSGSMIPTLAIDQRILAFRLAGNPGIGDIVVFHPPAGSNNEISDQCGSADEGYAHATPCDTPTPQESSETYVKRVVGLPGDHLRIVGGRVYRNGTLEKASYAQPCATGASFCNFPTTIVVPPGDYFMMGDNRGISDDSRFWGPVPGRWIIGDAIFTYWPPDRIGTL